MTINDLTDPNNPYAKYWRHLVKDNLPNNANKIIKVDFNEFKKKYHNSKNDLSKKKLVDSLLSGDVYLLKNAFSKKWLEDLKNYVIQKKFQPKQFEFYNRFYAKT